MLFLTGNDSTCTDGFLVKKKMLAMSIMHLLTCLSNTHVWYLDKKFRPEVVR